MDDLTQRRQPRTWSSLWSIPMMCLGLGIIAACVLVPQAEANKKLTAERDKLKRDLAYVDAQLSVNDEFLKNVGGDAGLAERLAQRQMKVIREGTSVLELKNRTKRQDMSPFTLVSIAPPPAPAPYRVPTGVLGSLCQDARYQLYVSGLGMLMVAAGLVLGSSSKTT
jgi:hypothetical protein